MRLLAAALLLAFLAGCSDPPPSEHDTTKDLPTQGGSGNEAQAISGVAGDTAATFAWDGETVGSYCAETGVAMDGCLGVHEIPDDVTYRIQIPAGARSLHVELTWTAGDLRTERLVVYVEDGEGTRHAAEGPSPLAINLEDLPPGAANVWAYPSPPAGLLPARAHDPQVYHAEARIGEPTA